MSDSYLFLLFVCCPCLCVCVLCRVCSALLFLCLLGLGLVLLVHMVVCVVLPALVVVCCSFVRLLFVLPALPVLCPVLLLCFVVCVAPCSFVSCLASPRPLFVCSFPSNATNGGYGAALLCSALPTVWPNAFASSPPTTPLLLISSSSLSFPRLSSCYLPLIFSPCTISSLLFFSLALSTSSSHLLSFGVVVSVTGIWCTVSCRPNKQKITKIPQKKTTLL